MDEIVKMNTDKWRPGHFIRNRRLAERILKQMITEKSAYKDLLDKTAMGLIANKLSYGLIQGEIDLGLSVPHLHEATKI